MASNAFPFSVARSWSVPCVSSRWCQRASTNIWVRSSSGRSSCNQSHAFGARRIFFEGMPSYAFSCSGLAVERPWLWFWASKSSQR